jgi:two-component system phosphate regulon sensor histidine kinase PhoR
MNKRVIWLIIGIMSAAVIGVVATQFNLVLADIRVNEETFDKNVQNALSVVAERLEDAAKKDDLRKVANGYSIDDLGGGGLADALSSGNGGLSIPVDVEGSLTEIEEDRLCPDCRRRHQLGFDNIQGVTYDYINIYRPIEERVNPTHLERVLQQELQNNAIKTAYEFGVYSNEREAFVIRDGQLLVDDLLAVHPATPVRYLELANSPYRVTLFEEEKNGGEAAGTLNIFFPDKSKVMWSSLLPSLIGTFLFAALILACFSYTIWVIFDQKRLSEMKTDFINNMTHEFKTPIATISLAADSIANPKISGDVSKVLRFANIIKQENKRMNNQVEKVLQMAQIDRRESKLRLTEVDLHDVILRAVENIGLQVEPRMGTAKAVFEASNPIIDGDQTHVSNVINNLLDNANKYSPEAPVITVSTKDKSEGVIVTISDQGMGMNKESLKHIFDKFYRVHTGDIHDVKGFGLGLSYVKAIMDAHKGTIDVKSEVGKGSAFTLFFPRHQEKQAMMT